MTDKQTDRRTDRQTDKLFGQLCIEIKATLRVANIFQPYSDKFFLWLKTLKLIFKMRVLMTIFLSAIFFRHSA